MKKFIKIFIFVLAISFSGLYVFGGPCGSGSALSTWKISDANYGSNNGVLGFNRCIVGATGGDVTIYGPSNNIIAFYPQSSTSNCYNYSVGGLAPGTYHIHWYEFICGPFGCADWCYDDQYVTINSIYPCPVYYGFQANNTTLGNSDGSILINFDHLDYFQYITDAYAYNYSTGYYYSGQAISSSTYAFYGLPEGVYHCYIQGNPYNHSPCSYSCYPVINSKYPCPVFQNYQSIMESSPGCSDGSITLNFDHLDYFSSISWAYAIWVTGGAYDFYYGYLSGNSFVFPNLPSGDYSIEFIGTPINNTDCSYFMNITVPGNPCHVTLTVDKSDAIANCVNGSMIISTIDEGTYAYHVAYLKDIAGNTLQTKTFYSDKTDFENVIPGSYTVEVRTYASNSSSCYCSDSKPVTITSGGPVFYSPTITPADVGAHGCTNGKIRIDFNNVNDNYYLNYWSIPYKARYSAYLYDSNWNVITSANNLFTSHEFTNLAPGSYNILTVGTRYDAQSCSSPAWSNATINEPSCITFDVLDSTNTTTRCADDGTITASFTNWAGACDQYIKLFKVNANSIEEQIDQWVMGDGPLPVTWSGLQSNLVFNGNYRVEAHAGDCTISQNISIGVPACAVTVSATGSSVHGCVGSINGTINNACGTKNLQLHKGATLVSSLSTNSNTFSFDSLSSGIYTVSLTASDNLSGCTATTTARVRNAICPVPVNITATQMPGFTKKVVITWDSYSCAPNYTLQIRIAGMSTWSTYTQATNTKTIANIFKNTVYEYRVRTNCSSLYSSAYSAIQTYCYGNCSAREAAIENNISSNGLTIYPNPASDYVMVESGLSSDNILSFKVFDQTGRLVVVNKTIEGETIKINTYNFTEGIYIVQIISPDAVLEGKFIIHK